MNSNSMFTCISTAGIALFLAGQTSFQLNVTPAGTIPISGLAQPLFGSQAGSTALSSILTAEETNLFAKEYEVVVNRSIQAQALLASSMLPAGVGGVPNPPQYLDPVTNMLTDNPLAASLQTVARIIGGRAASASTARSSTSSSAASIPTTARRPLTRSSSPSLVRLSSTSTASCKLTD